MANKITCDDLQALLKKHLQGTALEPLGERKDYVTDPDGFVAAKTIDRLCDAIEQMVRIQKMPNPRRKSGVAQHVVNMQQAIKALQPYKGSV